MSATHGDKARHHRLRKLKLARRHKLAQFREEISSPQSVQPATMRPRETRPKAA